jgi:ABC-2 type transport system permease protein
MLIMLSIPIMLYGLDMARAIIEEKTSRIFEVMLAVTKPSDLLAGKLVGVGGVGLTQIAIWVIGGTIFMGSALATSLLTGDIAISFSWTEGIFFPIYFVLGFALFSAIFSGLAATCETSQDLQKFMWVAIVPLYNAVSADLALHNDFAHGYGRGSILADCPVHNPAGADHLGHTVVLLASLSSRHPDVWEARDAAGTGAVVAV